MLKYNVSKNTVRSWVGHTPHPDSAGLAFALVSMGEYDSDDSYFTERDGLPQGLLLYTLGGCGVLEYRGTRLELPPGRLAVLDCAEWQYYRTKPGHRWHFRWMHFSGAGAMQLVAAVNRDALFAPVMTAGAFNSHWDMLAAMAPKVDPYSAHAVSLELHLLLAGLVRRKGRQASSEHTRQLPCVEAAAAYMEQNLAAHLALDDIARAGSMSKYHFTRVFARVKGATPYQYLTALRVAEAKRLLQATPRPVNAVGAAVGFADVKVFIRCFKRATGMTPLQYRKCTVTPQ